jgi:hypothetical protein
VSQYIEEYGLMHYIMWWLLSAFFAPEVHTTVKMFENAVE